MCVRARVPRPRVVQVQVCACPVVPFEYLPPNRTVYATKRCIVKAGSSIFFRHAYHVEPPRKS